MIQQSPQTSLSGSHFNKHIPMSSFALTDSRINQTDSILCTPENYMLVLGYCTSLEKEVERLKDALQCAREKEKAGRNIYGGLQQTAKQGPGTKAKEGTLLSFAATSFGMARSHATQRAFEPQIQEKQISACGCDYNDEIIALLKQENKSLNIKIKRLYKQNEKLIENYQKWLEDPKLLAKAVLHRKVGYTQSGGVGRVQRPGGQLPPCASQQLTALESQASRTMQRVILSQPNSFDISFQVFPSLKSLQDLSQPHHPRNAIYF